MQDKQAHGTSSYFTRSGIRITRTSEPATPTALEELRLSLTEQRGVLLSSSFEYPGRYTRSDVGFVNPPLVIEGRARSFTIRALNARGRMLLPTLAEGLRLAQDLSIREQSDDVVAVLIAAPALDLPEEQRTRRASPISLVRAVRELFAAEQDAHLGLYGAFGYDLVFQLDGLTERRPRDGQQRDLVLYLPDELLVMDHRTGSACRLRYELAVDGVSTSGLPRDGAREPYRGASQVSQGRDHSPGDFARLVGRARAFFERGDLFEVTPSQVFRAPSPGAPAELFRLLRERNPAPYGFLINLGEREYLVGASPEMYVRVTGRRVETCPIAGTIARGNDALDDACQIQKLLSSPKEESELTMCTDVDRNDKARICEPGSVRVIGRRQIELYSRLIHTVDHVEGQLRVGYDALDAFMTHLWAVTVTGAPKLAALQFIEDHERSPRRFYGGAVGHVGFDGNLNTGLTLRTMRIADGIAEVRAGATVLFESVPQEEEAESELKASALLGLLQTRAQEEATRAQVVSRPGTGQRVLLVDCEDSFVHTLADYFRQAGAEVSTMRHRLAQTALRTQRPDLCVLSPGPGRPADFQLATLLDTLVARRIATFGVCLGLQAIAELLGGRLAQLSRPVHGKQSRVRVLGGSLFAGLPDELTVGRYHSLHAERSSLPSSLHVTAETSDEHRLVMAIEQPALRLSAVQFHPESIMSAARSLGLTIVSNALAGSRAGGSAQSYLPLPR